MNYAPMRLFFLLRFGCFIVCMMKKKKPVLILEEFMLGFKDLGSGFREDQNLAEAI